jgi:hypothetical protein
MVEANGDSGNRRGRRLAFDTSHAYTTLLSVVGREPIADHSEVVEMVCRESDGAWKIARIIAAVR